jgi:hypothetical protein
MQTAENNNTNEKPKHPVVERIKKIIQFFQALTAQKATDNIWIIGIKYFLQGLMVLVLLALSPFAIFAILVSVIMAG